ncbi:Histone-lysine N-methyltransferase, H3 lysine-9 specific protein [Thalictrum thalictroides]|uniref:Histone-lysine N-methyltransferase, H3 lysine-9 specific protein n=1 Tax=Thalictrum thalictroides TaxID=46969 RepID=A0A7J6VRZ7_THATH|nr:Histone-lysine N-methyltransferase, H3 lysine-9 specific protein [Thalictrum thalictroides]
MVPSIVSDVTTAEKSESCFPPLKYKKRNVSAKRDFPQNCGRNAPRINLEPKKGCLVSVKDCGINTAKTEDDSVVSVKRECLESCGQCVSPINMESNEDGIAVKSFESLGLETNGAFAAEQLGSSVKLGSFEVIECSSQIESPDLPKDLLSKTKSSLKAFNQVEALQPVKILDHMVINGPRSLNTKSVRNPNSPRLYPKPRGTVSAHRDFPEGCGRNFSQVKAKSKQSGGSVEKMNVVTDGALSEPLSVNQSGGLMELQVPTSSGQIESNDLLLLKDSILDATANDEVKQMAETVLEEDTFGNKLQGIIIIIDEDENEGEAKSTRAVGKEIVEFVHENEDLESKLNEEVVAETSIGKQIVQDNAKQMAEKLQDDDTFTRRLQEVIIISDESEDEVDVKLAETIEENKFEYVHDKEDFDIKLKEEDVGETSSQSLWKNNISQSDLNAPSLSKQLPRGCGISGEKLGMDSEKFCKDTSLKRKLPKESVDNSCSVNQSEMQLLGLEHYNKRLVGQALIAAPNCPWNFGKRTSKFPSDCKSPSSSKDADQGNESSGEKLGTESSEFSEDLSSKIKFPNESADKDCAFNQSEVQLLGLDHSNKMLIVQALMAAPNCPWNLGKQTFKFISDPESPSSSKDVDRGSESSGEKPVTESSQFSEDLSLKRKFPGESSHGYCALNQSQVHDFFKFWQPGERVVVQALMALPNCPWTMGKETSKSPSGLSNAKAKSKQGKLELVVHDDSKSVSWIKQAKIGKSKVKFTKKKNSPGNISYEDAHQLVLVKEDDNTRPGMEDDGFSLQTSENMELSLVPYGFHKSDDKDDDIEVDNTNNKIGEALHKDQDSLTMDLTLIPFGVHSFLGTNDDNRAGVTRMRVRETLRLFQGLLRKLMQDAESKSKNAREKPSGRPDLVSAKILKEKKKWVNTGKPILGTVPGVEVGDEFHFRVELAIIGLHRPYQSGIDYSKMNGKVLATSVVASGGYADDMDSSDVLNYSGQGGLPNGDKEAEDQKLERGNLSLKNSCDERTPVRVIRGFKEPKGNDSSDSKGKMVSTYTYDGLYFVEKYWEEIGPYGTKVFKFELRRIPGQPELAIKEVKKSKKSRVRKGLCVDDISQGRETMCICAINTMDDENPPLFEYITDMIYPPWYNRDIPKGCECVDGCSDSETCFCAIKNGGEIPFNYDGAIVEAKPLVYECGPSCKCPPSCHNRVSQKGIQFKLEIFKTESRGWGVRSLTSIPSGSFICEYTGELLEDKEAEQRSNDEYLFDIGHNYNDPALWEGVSNLVPDGLKSSSSREDVDNMGFTIDAARYGNVGRFVNHSCSPNLYAQNVLYDHDDKRMPHIMLFAAENIPPLQELTYHYNYELDQVHDSDGNVRKKNCYCGSDECTGRLY